MVRVFVQKQFAKWAASEGIADATLIDAAQAVLTGGADADLGGYLFKMRVARQAAGKSGGFRTILCFRKGMGEPIFFLHGFAKNAKASLSAAEEKALRLIAKSLVGLDGAQIASLVERGSIREIERAKE